MTRQFLIFNSLNEEKDFGSIHFNFDYSSQYDTAFYWLKLYLCDSWYSISARRGLWPLCLVILPWLLWRGYYTNVSPHESTVNDIGLTVMNQWGPSIYRELARWMVAPFSCSFLNQLIIVGWGYKTRTPRPLYTDSWITYGQPLEGHAHFDRALWKSSLPRLQEDGEYGERRMTSGKWSAFFEPYHAITSSRIYYYY